MKDIYFKAKRKVFQLVSKNQNEKSAYYETWQSQVECHYDLSYPSSYPNHNMDIYRPKNESGTLLPCIIWVHGGGWISKDKAFSSEYGIALASYQYVVVNLNYALAPEYYYPSQIKQIDEAISFLQKIAIEEGIDPTKIFLAGDSAGAHMISQYAALVTSQPYRNALGIYPALVKENLCGLLLYGGLYNLETIDDVYFPWLKTFLWDYLGGKNYQEEPTLRKELSLPSFVTKDYPPCYLVCGDFDPLLSQSKEWEECLKKKEIPVDTLFFPRGTGLLHEFQFHLDKKESLLSLEDALTFLKDHS